MVTQIKPTLVYVETKREILDPVPLLNQSYRSFFINNEEAQAIWIMRPDAREPFRVGWKQALWK